MNYNDDRNVAPKRRENAGSAAPDDQVQREIQEAQNYLELQKLRKRVEEERKKEADAQEWEKAKTEWQEFKKEVKTDTEAAFKDVKSEAETTLKGLENILFLALLAYLVYWFCK
ncbi:MAG: hypothetical protein IJY15_11155 [Thermoguttaceae bacterium]|nr:hypothetical protein [Thermoguttaceae bacterium]